MSAGILRSYITWMCLVSRFLRWAVALSFLATLVNASTHPEIIQHLSIYEKRDAYSAWPAIGRAANGDILVLFTRTEEHMSPNGEILMTRSKDNGQSWLPPTILFDTIVDDRESGLTVLRDGRLLTHLRSVKFPESTYTSMSDSSYPPELRERWTDYVWAKRSTGTPIISTEPGKRCPQTMVTPGAIPLPEPTRFMAAFN